MCPISSSSRILNAGASGFYTLRLVSADAAQLRLAANADSPADALCVARIDYRESGATVADIRTQSVSVYLEAGKRYSIEILRKAGTGRDCLSLKWVVPGSQQSAVIGEDALVRP